MSDCVFIYGLVDPRSGEVRYVGKTMHSPEQRRDEHVREARRMERRGRRLSWIRKLTKLGMVPSVTVLDTVNENDWQTAEKDWIARLPNLLNDTVGGEAGPDLSGAKHPRPHLGKHRPEAERQRISETLKAKGIKRTPEHVEKMRVMGQRDTNPNAKLTTAQANAIRDEYSSTRTTQRKLAQKYGVSQPTIFLIVNQTQLSGEGITR